MGEEVAQIFTLELIRRKIIGTVGALEFELIHIAWNLNLDLLVGAKNLNVHNACWVDPTDPKNKKIIDFKRVKSKFLAKVKSSQLVFFADSAFTLQMTQSKYPNVNCIL